MRVLQDILAADLGLRQQMFTVASHRTMGSLQKIVDDVRPLDEGLWGAARVQ